ncbi:MAG: thioredoxin family protein [Beijerinckiaceae bacterium]
MTTPSATPLLTRRAAVTLVSLGLAAPARAAEPAVEMLMVRRPGCPWCVAWDRQIGPAWPNTAVGKRAPVRMIDITEVNVKYKGHLKSTVVFTPTFVLLHAGSEVGRIEGYAGEEFFWGLAEKLVARLPPAA